ncbi:GNAT family N-acetyltransferase [Candidatus Omnitrophota bacterium]
MKLCVEDKIFEVLIVRRGPLLEKAQLLRGEVFLGKGQKDHDQYDRSCEHVVVVDQGTGAVVGTYRLLLSSVAWKEKGDKGFYAETEFDLKNIRKNCRGELLEMGRACVDPDYRKYPVINFMWKAITTFVRERKVKFIFGCASIDQPDPEKVGKIYSFLKERVYSPPRLRVFPRKDKGFPCQKDPLMRSQREALRLMPSLVKGYLTVGAYICGEPVWDRDFNTADFFMMIDTAKMNTSFLEKFFYAKGA